MPKRANVEGAVSEYKEKRPLYDRFAAKLKVLLEELLSAKRIDYHVIEHRAKEVEAFREKITRAGKRYSDPVREVTDLAGVRVVLYYTSDVDRACRVIKEEFDVDQSGSVDKGESLKPDQFGYRSVHYVVSLCGARAGLAEWANFAGFRAEIQVRTVLQHAWASVSHRLQYKHERDVPTLFRRRLSVLSGLFELADEQFLALRREQTKLSQMTSRKIEKGDTDLELNLITVEEFLKKSPLIREVELVANEIGFEFYEPDDYITWLLHYCFIMGLHALGDLSSSLNDSLPWWRNYLRELYVAFLGETGDCLLAPSRLVVCILLRANKDKVSPDYLVSHGWSKGLAELMLVPS